MRRDGRGDEGTAVAVSGEDRCGHLLGDAGSGKRCGLEIEDIRTEPDLRLVLCRGCTAILVQKVLRGLWVSESKAQESYRYDLPPVHVISASSFCDTFPRSQRPATGPRAH